MQFPSPRRATSKTKMATATVEISPSARNDISTRRFWIYTNFLTAPVLLVIPSKRLFPRFRLDHLSILQ